MNLQLRPVRLVRLLSPAIVAMLLPLAFSVLAPAPAVAAQAQFDVMIQVIAAQTRPQTGVCDSTTTVDGLALVCKARPEVSTTIPPVREIATPLEQISEPSAVVANPAPSSGETSIAASPAVTSQTAKGSAVHAGVYRFTSAITGAVGWVDIYTSAGMTTAFRLVNWADREYIEMTVRW